MNPDHVHFADWDAAYVMGALGSADRRAYEAHLEECRACREAVAELASMPGLLSRVARDRGESMVQTPAESGPSAAARARLLERGTREARRRRAVWWGGALAAAAAVVVAIVLAVTTAIAPALRSTRVVALEPVVDVPWTATVELVDVAWGTRLEMICRYTGQVDADAPDASWPYVLIVTADDGSTSELSTWRARPGTTTRLDAGTALDPDDIAAIEVRALDDDRVLLRADLEASVVE